MSLKIVLLVREFAPYRVAIWNELVNLCNLHIILLSQRAKNRQWTVVLDKVNANVHVLNGSQIYFPWLEWNLHYSGKQVTKVLEKISPDTIIMDGYDSPGFWEARRWAINRQIPMVFWMESTHLSSSVKTWFITNIKRRFLSPFDGFYAISENSSRYLNKLGVDQSKVTTGLGIPVDPIIFTSATKLSSSHEPVLLYVGRIISNKGVFDILYALNELCHLSWRLILIGEGKARGILSRMVMVMGLSERIEFLGYKQMDELPKIYQQADIFLFPTKKDVWGVVVNEAMLSGLYVIGSNKAASCLELIREDNGQLINPDDTNQLVAAIEKALRNHPFDREKIRASALKVTPKGEAGNIMRAIIQAQAAHRVDLSSAGTSTRKG